jgi:hypothetical protein
VSPSAHLKTETTSFWNVIFSSHSEFRTMDKVHKPSNSECYIPSSEHFRNYIAFHPKRCKYLCPRRGSQRCQKNDIARATQFVSFIKYHGRHEMKRQVMGDHVTCFVTIELSLGLKMKHHAMKTHEGAGHSSIILDLGEWLASRPPPRPPLPCRIVTAPLWLEAGRTAEPVRKIRKREKSIASVRNWSPSPRIYRQRYPSPNMAGSERRTLQHLHRRTFTFFFRLCAACQRLKHFIVFSTLNTLILKILKSDNCWEHYKVF